MGWSISNTSSGGGGSGVQSVTGLNTDNTDTQNYSDIFVLQKIY
jgi:hypothetical protein